MVVNQLLITDWLGEKMLIKDAVKHRDIFYQPETRYVYCVSHSDHSSISTAMGSYIAIVDNDGLVQATVYGGSYRLEKQWEVISIVKPVEFMAKLWTIHHEINKIDYANQLLHGKDRVIAELNAIVDTQIGAIKSLKDALDRYEASSDSGMEEVKEVA